MHFTPQEWKKHRETCAAHMKIKALRAKIIIALTR